jgi:hypothetical protein
MTIVGERLAHTSDFRGQTIADVQQGDSQVTRQVS